MMEKKRKTTRKRRSPRRKVDHVEVAPILVSPAAIHQDKAMAHPHKNWAT